MQPDGGWGYSNSGLVVSQESGGSSLVVDILFDVPKTQRMLDSYLQWTKSAPIKTLVNTHSNGDHTFGNELFGNLGADIISTKACAEEMDLATPAFTQKNKENQQNIPGGIWMGERMLNKFEYRGINYTKPNKTFEGTTSITLDGDRKVDLYQELPCHTLGDAIVHVKDAKVCYAGDLLFIGGTPIVRFGPFENWIKACDHMIELNCEKYVPGHGPITTARGVAAVRDYLQYIQEQTRKRFDQGMGVIEAAKSIDLMHYKEWTDAERIVVNVNTLYKHWGHPGEDENPEHGPMPFWKLMSLMEQ